MARGAMRVKPAAEVEASGAVLVKADVAVTGDSRSRPAGRIYLLLALGLEF